MTAANSPDPATVLRLLRERNDSIVELAAQNAERAAKFLRGVQRPRAIYRGNQPTELLQQAVDELRDAADGLASVLALAELDEEESS